MSNLFNGVDMEFLDKIHTTVIQALLPVDGEGELSRDRRLHALFNDLTCRIDLEVRHHFKNDTPIAPRYYLMMSHYYLEFPEKAEEVLYHSVHVWNSLHMPLIFTLLFHEYLFIKCANDPEYSIKRLASFVKGANKLFWLDLENSSKRFAYIWMFLLKGVLQVPERWKCMLSRRYLDVFDLVAKFYFYYHGERDLLPFIEDMKMAFSKNELDTPQDHTKLVPVNMFCNEVVRTMKLIKSEEVLQQYLQHCRCFGQNELHVTGKKTMLRLGDLLSDLATPGYPMYPTPEIKEEAKRTLNLLWPYGAFMRETIRFSFRLLRPLSFITWFHYRGAQLRSLIAYFWLWIVGTIVWLLSFIPFAPVATVKSKEAKQVAMAEAQRQQRIVDHLSEEAKLTAKATDKRRVRFKLPDSGDEGASRASMEDEEEKEIAPPNNRAQSPLRSPSKPRKSSNNAGNNNDYSQRESIHGDADMEEAMERELFSHGPNSPSSSSIVQNQSNHSTKSINKYDSADDEDDEDIDDVIDEAELEKYVNYSHGIAQTQPRREAQASY